MPTFDYQCSACKSVQEEFQSISATPKIKCKKCGASCVKLFSVTQNVIFKGGGWPSHDIKSKSQMTKKNSRMKSKMVEREKAGDAVNNIGELKKKKNASL
jgi:putative FmdB family regulatory protein